MSLSSPGTRTSGGAWWAHALVIAAAFAGLAAVSWRKWPDVMVDFGHELYIPWRLAQGEVLYRDIVFPLGPASQYFMAGWFALLGESLMTAAVVNLALLVFLVAMLHAVFRRVGSRGSATSIVLFFLAVFGFSQYTAIGNYNYVTPYRHEVTHGLILCVAAVWCLTKWIASRRRHWLLGGAAAVGLTFLVKVEFAVPAIGIAIWTTFAQWSKLSRADILASLGTVAGVILAAWVLLVMQMTPVQAAEALAVNWQLALNPELTSGSGFYRALSGLHNVEGNLINMATSLAMNLGLLAFAGLVHWLLGPVPVTRTIRVMVSSTVFVVALLLVPGETWHRLPQSFLVFDLLALAYSTVRIWRSTDTPEGRWTILGAWSVLAMLLVPKMLLQLGWGHYGFVLAAPSALLVLHAAIFEIPAWLETRTNQSGHFKSAALGIAFACAASLQFQSARGMLVRILPIAQGADQYFVEPRYDGRAVVMHRLLHHLDHSMTRSETLLVIPDGTMLNFLLRRRNPTGHVLLSPWEIAAFGEQRILDDVRENPPTVIVLFDEDMSIHGRGNFGDPRYGAALRKWIEDEYQLTNSFSQPDPVRRAFRAYIFRRLAPPGGNSP